MSYITVESTVKTIKVDFGGYAGAQIPTGNVPSKKVYQKHYIEVSLPANADFINVNTYSEVATFPVSYNGAPNTFRIQSVNGVAPTDNDHLYNLIIALLD